MSQKTFTFIFPFSFFPLNISTHLFVIFLFSFIESFIFHIFCLTFSLLFFLWFFPLSLFPFLFLSSFHFYLLFNSFTFSFAFSSFSRLFSPHKYLPAIIKLQTSLILKSVNIRFHFTKTKKHKESKNITKFLTSWKKQKKYQ